MGIRFDAARCIQDLQARLVIVMVDLQAELLADAKQGMLTSEGAESLQAGDVEMVANVITVSIVGGAWAAMDSYGTGSEMDLFNPALPGYFKGQAWNPARGNDTTIRSRSDAPGQVDIFGKPVRGKGPGGYDLEEAGIVDAQPPSHAIETAMRWMRHGRMREKIKETIAYFPFSRYFKITKR